MNKNIKKFLITHHSVSEIFLASFLVFVTILLAFQKQNFTDDFLPGFIAISSFSIYIITLSSLVLFFNKNDIKSLRLLQVLGMFLIMAISVFYLGTSLALIDETNPINYIFMSYAIFELLKIFIIYKIITHSSERQLKKYYRNMPTAKKISYNHFFLPAIFLIISYTYYQNIANLNIALGQSFFVGIFLLGVINKFKRFN